MLNIIRTTSEDSRFLSLIQELDTELALMDGQEHDFYAQYNKIDHIKNVIIALIDDDVVGCGAFKKIDDHSIEIKRMYTAKSYRSQGIAKQVLAALEKWAMELSFTEARLETGKRQESAISLYSREGYTKTKNYGPYVNVENSLCFKKSLLNY